MTRGVLVVGAAALAHDIVNPFVILGQNPIPTGQPGGASARRAASSSRIPSGSSPSPG